MKRSIFHTTQFLLLFFVAFSSVQGNPSTVSYLGLHTQKLSQVLSHQLNFPQGIYLEVIHVGEGSPAEKAGVQIFDILQKMDGQILVNSDQFKQLVWLRKPEDKVSLDLIRKGSALTLTATLNETQRKKQNQQILDMDPLGESSFLGDQFLANPRIRDLFEKARKQGFPGSTFDSFMPDFHTRHTIPPSQPVLPGANSPVHEPGSDVQSFSYKSSEYQKVVTDEQGTLHYTEKDGKKFLRATDPKGKLLFEGPVNTKQDREELPAGLLLRLQAMEAK